MSYEPLRIFIPSILMSCYFEVLGKLSAGATNLVRPISFNYAINLSCALM